MKDGAWDEVATKVSAVSGVKRDRGEIKKKWAVIKSAAKMKAAAINRERVRTGGGQSAEGNLTGTEQRVVGLMSGVVVEGLSTAFDSADDMLQSLTCK